MHNDSLCQKLVLPKRMMLWISPNSEMVIGFGLTKAWNPYWTCSWRKRSVYSENCTWNVDTLKTKRSVAITLLLMFLKHIAACRIQSRIDTVEFSGIFHIVCHTYPYATMWQEIKWGAIDDAWKIFCICRKSQKAVKYKSEAVLLQASKNEIWISLFHCAFMIEPLLIHYIQYITLYLIIHQTLSLMNSSLY